MTYIASESDRPGTYVAADQPPPVAAVVLTPQPPHPVLVRLIDIVDYASVGILAVALIGGWMALGTLAWALTR